MRCRQRGLHCCFDAINTRSTIIACLDRNRVCFSEHRLRLSRNWSRTRKDVEIVDLMENDYIPKGHVPHQVRIHTGNAAVRRRAMSILGRVRKCTPVEA